MNKGLKKRLCLGLSLLMLTGIGVSANNGNYTHASVAKRYGRRIPRHHVKRTQQLKRLRRKRVNRYNHKIKIMRRHKKSKRNRKALKSRFKRFNNRRALKRSGFFDAHSVGGNFIFDKYAPNDKRAVVPKRMNVDNWYKGKFGDENPTAYQYQPKFHSWKILK